mgnify:CR=1 FL=1
MRDACQMEMSIGKPYVKTTEFGEDSVIIMIGITGEMRGQVMIAMKITKACEIASKMMMGMPVPELDEMAMSAISELGNMIMGNAATILSLRELVLILPHLHYAVSYEDFADICQEYMYTDV